MQEEEEEEQIFKKLWLKNEKNPLYLQSTKGSILKGITLSKSHNCLKKSQLIQKVNTILRSHNLLNNHNPLKKS